MKECLLPKPLVARGLVTLFDFANLMGEMLYLITILFCVYFSWGRADTSSDGQELFLAYVGELSCKSFALFNFPGASWAPYLTPSSVTCPPYEDIWHCDQITWPVRGQSIPSLLSRVKIWVLEKRKYVSAPNCTWQVCHTEGSSNRLNADLTQNCQTLESISLATSFMWSHGYPSTGVRKYKDTWLFATITSFSVCSKLQPFVRVSSDDSTGCCASPDGLTAISHNA